jgi:ATP-dependent RNA helicase DeaD
VTEKQRPEIARIEREAKTSIGEWEPPEERLEHAPRPRRREREPVPSGGSEPERPPGNGLVKLFVNRGRRSGIDDEDVRWALTEGAVIPEEAIGSIRVLDRFSFVELDAGHAARALERLEGTKLKGKQIRVEYARG